MTHLFNGMSALHHRDPGLVGAALDDDRLTPTLIADGVHVHPAALRLAVACKQQIALVSDAVGVDGTITARDGAAYLAGRDVGRRDRRCSTAASPRWSPTGVPVGRAVEARDRGPRRASSASKTGGGSAPVPAPTSSRSTPRRCASATSGSGAYRSRPRHRPAGDDHQDVRRGAVAAPGPVARRRRGGGRDPRAARRRRSRPRRLLRRRRTSSARSTTWCTRCGTCSTPGCCSA